MDKDQLFLAQFNQIWEHKRHHVRLVWSTATVTGVVIGFVGSNFEAIRPHVSIYTFCALLLIFLLCASLLFFRHNSVQKGLQYTLRELLNNRRPLSDLPLSATNLRDRYRDEFGRESWLSSMTVWSLNQWTGVAAWLGILVVVITFIVALCFQLSKLPLMHQVCNAVLFQYE